MPGVKLRPAAPEDIALSKQKGRILAHSSWPRPSELDFDDSQNTSVDPCHRPFKGVVLCTTGIENKASLHGYVIQNDTHM